MLTDGLGRQHRVGKYLESVNRARIMSIEASESHQRSDGEIIISHYFRTNHPSRHESKKNCNRRQNGHRSDGTYDGTRAVFMTVRQLILNLLRGSCHG